MKLSEYQKRVETAGQPLPQPLESRSVYVHRQGARLSRLPFLILVFCGCVGGPVPDPPNIETQANEPNTPYASAETTRPTATVNTVQPSDPPPSAEGVDIGISGFAGTTGSQTAPTNTGGIFISGSGGVELTPGGSQDAGLNDRAADPTEAGGYYPPFDPLTIANLQVNSIVDPLFTDGSFFQSVLVIQGKPDALSPGQTLWVFNLNTNAPPSIASAAEDGSFEIEISYRLGDVLRFQVRQGEIYHEPIDLELSQDSLTLVPIERVECISIPVQITLEQSAPLLIDNQCEQAITVLDVAWRAEGVPIAVEDAVGAVIDPLSASELNLLVTSDEIQPWTNEDILLITIGLGSEEIRFATSVTIQ